MRDPLAEVEDLFTGAGGRAYLGEDVTIATHMLQAAACAEASGAGSVLVAAALLHDVGYLVGAHEVDHADVGAAWLARWLPPTVTEPVRLHVQAKRYLCGAEELYAASLSGESARTLRMQGGPMSRDEAAAFGIAPHGDDAVAVRRFDDLGKVAGASIRPIASYRRLLGWLVTG
jgi:gamma-butyrobetaine dioxygenase